MRYLIDSNILIYAAINSTSLAYHFIEKNKDLAVSFITYLEVLGYANLSENDQQAFQGFFKAVPMIMIDDDILETAVALRQAKAMTLGDAIIAATALEGNYPLVTHNVKDFKHIEKLDLIDPFEQ